MDQQLVLGKAAKDAEVSLSSKALTTHAFVLGMTGSGKTGLCVVLVEELLAQRVPVIAVDSKGDLATLLLRFGAKDSSVRRWGDDGAASRIEVALAARGWSGDQDNQIRAGYESRLFTPGSTIGLPVNILGDLRPPGTDAEGQAASAETLSSTLLALLGIEVDPLTSREHLLLVQIITSAWSKGLALTLPDLVRSVGQPPFQVVGALPLEDFFPAKDRQGLMVRLNALLASPRLAAWTSGEALDPGALFRSPDGRPRLSVYSVAHLSDSERIQAVGMLLDRTLSWMRRQGGSGELKGVVLLDEIYGYFPPNPASPPTKPPLIALLKQARAFGVSIVLATQNPIDLDYRGLANIGSWFVGRLQTEQDKARIRDALSAAAASAGGSPTSLDALISKLVARQFLLHSIHLPEPKVFKTRDALTLLHGPFSEDELRELARPSKGQHAGATNTIAGGMTPQGASEPSRVAAKIEAATVPLSGLESELGPLFGAHDGSASLYLVVKAGVRYRVGADTTDETVQEFAYPVEGAQTPEEVLEAQPLSRSNLGLQDSPPSGMAYATVATWTTTCKAARLKAAVKDRLPAKLTVKLWTDPASKLCSTPGESLEAFTSRVATKRGGSAKATDLQRKLEATNADISRLEGDVKSRTVQKWLDVGTGLFNLFQGRRSSITSASKALSANRMQGTAESRLEALKAKAQQLQSDLDGLTGGGAAQFEQLDASPRATDVKILRVCWAFIA